GRSARSRRGGGARNRASRRSPDVRPPARRTVRRRAPACTRPRRARTACRRRRAAAGAVRGRRRCRRGTSRPPAPARRRRTT
ncbi:conserved hypothetical protein, partial [Ricinus communis]